MLFMSHQVRVRGADGVRLREVMGGFKRGHMGLDAER